MRIPPSTTGHACIALTKICSSCGAIGHMERACRERPNINTVEQISHTDREERINETGGGSQHIKTSAVEINPPDDQTERTDLGREMHFPKDKRNRNEKRHNTEPIALGHNHQHQDRKYTTKYHGDRDPTTADPCQAPADIIPYKNDTTTPASAADTNTISHSRRKTTLMTPAPEPETENPTTPSS